jgi:tetratricopeptide (TPR) repeat protein
MYQYLVDQAYRLYQNQEYSEALRVSLKAMESDPYDWEGYYLVGQCYRFLGDYEEAINFLVRAGELGRNIPSVYLALGISLQLNKQYDFAERSLLRALGLNPTFVEAYNSLALTQKKQGKYEEALHNYDQALDVISKKIIINMRNTRSSQVVKMEELPRTENSLWLEYAMRGAIWWTSNAETEVINIAWPTADQAFEEEQIEKYNGLFFIDLPNDDCETTRMFLPNYFNTFCLQLKKGVYPVVMGNIGSVFEELGRSDEAQKYFEEAGIFVS